MRYVWLFGENEGKTANNNSFYFWRYIVNKHNDLDAYFVLEKNEKTMAMYRGFLPEEKKHLIWRDSIKHYQVFFMADMLFVTLSFKDVQPQRLFVKRYSPAITKPLVYLQHGTALIKQLGYENYYANNSLFRWVYYNPNIPSRLKDVNGFRDYQLYAGRFHPRYIELLRRANTVEAHGDLRILWFITWREYFGDNEETKQFLLDIEQIVTNERLQEYLEKRNARIRICLHPKFTEGQTKNLLHAIKNNSRIDMVHPNQIDVMDELAQRDVLITDYSSVGFDFTFLGKPVILYQNDLEAYSKKRAFYCDINELKAAAIQNCDGLIDCIVRETYGINALFANNMYKPEKMEDILNGKHIERMYQYFWEAQQKSIAFLGYDFSGIGGTVFATRALAEGLAEKGYVVRMFTCKQMNEWRFPAGVPMHPMYCRFQRRLIDLIKAKAIRGKRHYRYLLSDPACAAMPPISGLGMTYWMKNIHANTVVSTRESLHFFLNEATSPLINNKIYFFHTTAKLVDELFPGCIQKLNEMELSKVVFVTEGNKKALEQQFGFKNYQQACVLGNSVDSARSIERTQIQTVGEKEKYSFCTLLRVSKEREADIRRMIQFAAYLKEQQVTNMHIDVYGGGDYVNALKKQIADAGVANYVEYCGVEKDVSKVYREHDAAIDFSEKQSFGMVYIEAILNGSMVYCRHNEGADEVLRNMPECFYETDAELLDKLQHVADQTIEMLQERYDKISNRYSRNVIANRFEEFIEQ